MKNTQYAKILNHCKQHGFITVRDMYALGINSPTMRISEMAHNDRFAVEKETVRKYGSDGKQETHYTRYFVRNREVS